LQSRAPNSPGLARFTEAAQILTGRADASLADGMAWVQDLCAALHILPLSHYGLAEADFATLVAQAQKASSMKGNPIALTDEEVADILRQAI
jgi:alcohol dehydrogenase class IV